MRVIYLNAEDDADDTVVPRFMKANGERSRLFFISEEKQRLNFSDDRIREAIVSTGAKACILDPLASYLGADVSMNLANEVRPRFESLIEVARETGCAIIRNTFEVASIALKSSLCDALCALGEDEVLESILHRKRRIDVDFSHFFRPPDSLKSGE